MLLIHLAGLSFLWRAHGLLFKGVVEQRTKLRVPSISIFEVHKIFSRSLAEDLVDHCLNVMRLGRVLDLTDRRAVAASKAARQYRLLLSGAATYSMAQEHSAILRTQDLSYDGLPACVILKNMPEYMPRTLKPPSFPQRLESSPVSKLGTPSSSSWVSAFACMTSL